MSNSAIDTLLQVVAPPRASEGPPRAGETGGSFGPALEQALAADKPTAATAPTAPPYAAERPPADETSHAVEHDSPHDAEEDNVPAEAAEDAVDETPAEDEAAADAVEISVAAEAAASAVVQHVADPTERVKAETPEGELALVAAGDEAKTQADSASADADAGENETNNAAATLKKSITPPPTTLDEQVKPTRVRSAKDDAQHQGAGKPARTEKGEPNSAGRAATPSETELPAAEGAEASGDDGIDSTTPRTASNLTAEAAREADSPAAGAHENRKQTAGAHAQSPPTDTTAVVVELPDATIPDDADKLTDKAGAKPIVADNAAPPPGSRGSASLDRLTAPRAVHPGAPSTESDGGLQVDRARFIGRVEGAVRAAHQRDGRVHVRLSPPELGSLRIEITVQHGVLAARIEAETPAARNLLLDNLPALRERLAAQDMRVEKFDVDVRRDGGGQAGSGGAQDKPADQPAWREGDRPQRPTPNRPAPAARTPREAAAARISDAELDVRI